MADIDSIISGVGGNTKYDFSAFGDPVKSFFDANKQRAEFDTRRAFKDGVPTTPDGQPDFGAMSKTLFQKGDVSQGIAAANLGLAQQNMKFGQGQSQDITRVEGGAPPAPVISPSANRSASAVDGPPRTSGGAVPPQQGGPQTAPQGQGGETPASFLQKSGIQPGYNMEVALAAFKRAGIDPDQQFNPSDPAITAKLGPVLQRLKGVGQVQPPQPGDNPPQAPQAQPQPQVAQAPQPQAPQGQPAPVTNTVTTTAGPAAPSRTDQLIAYYSGVMSDPRSPKQNVELAKTRLEALQKSNELTPDQKLYAQFKLEGGQGTMQDFMADNEARKTAATEEAKGNYKKYEGLIEAGTKAQQEIPQLQMLQEQMNDPNFYSGVGEKYNLLYKRLKSAMGMDPDAAVPQEFLRKATAANVLSSLGALKGLGQIRVAEINMAREAASSPDNSVPANKLLTEISIRTHQRNSDIAELAQAYKEKNGSLDTGFDKQVTAYGKAHPLFTDAEIKDWGLSIGRAGKAQPQQAANAAPPVPDAKKAPDGNWYTPDPNRPGKYLKVVQ